MHFFSHVGDEVRTFLRPATKEETRKSVRPTLRMLAIVCATAISLCLWLGIYAIIRWML
jgi:hypothetical protein